VCGTRHKKRGKCVANRRRCSAKIPSVPVLVGRL
jgi:hypothetical protein